MFSELDVSMMRLAIEEARKAFNKFEVPIGAVLSDGERVISKAHNCVESAIDPVAHAELLCIKEGARRLNRWRLSGLVLYSTLEPCAMCTGAIVLSRISKVVWGASGLRVGEYEGCINLISLQNVKCITVGGLLADESSELLRTFFQRHCR